MTDAEFEVRIIQWARRQSGLQALVMGGSRAGVAEVDHLSDWDFQIITSRPRDYYHTDWVKEIACCWCSHAERTPRGVVKVSAIFAGGFEVDFVPLAAWQMKLVYAAMCYPNWTAWMPKSLLRGVQETRGFMLGSGYRLVVGDSRWERRLAALEVNWPQPELSAEEFAIHVSAFWTKAVWIFKKIARPEPRSAMHWLHLLVVHQVYPILAEEARLEGRVSRPEARKAEKWLGTRRLLQTAIATGPEQALMATALLTEITLFQEATQYVAAQRGFIMPDHGQLETWLRFELSRLTA